MENNAYVYFATSKHTLFLFDSLFKKEISYEDFRMFIMHVLNAFEYGDPEALEGALIEIMETIGSETHEEICLMFIEAVYNVDPEAIRGDEYRRILETMHILDGKLNAIKS